MQYRSSIKCNMLCISYLFATVYHNMQKLNKAALKQVLYLGVVYFYDCSVRIFYFDMELIIGIGILGVIGIGIRICNKCGIGIDLM